MTTQSEEDAKFLPGSYRNKGDHPKFEQGNQARLDLTREELTFMKLSLQVSLDECKQDGSIEVTKIYDSLLKKVREALDLYQ